MGYVAGYIAGLVLRGIVGGTALAVDKLSQNNGGYKPPRLSPHNLRNNAKQLKALRIRVQPDKWDPAKAVQVMERVLSLPGVVLEIVGEHGSIDFQVIPLDGDIEAVKLSLLAVMPGAQIDVMPARQPIEQPTYRLNIPVTLNTIFPAPIKGIDLLKDSDPLVAFTQSLVRLQPGDRVVLSVCIFGQSPEASQKGIDMITQSGFSAWDYGRGILAVWQIAMAKMSGNDRIPKFEPPVHNVLMAKLKQPLFHVVMNLQFNTTANERFQQLLESVSEQLTSFSQPEFNSLGAPDLKSLPKSFIWEAFIEQPEQAWHSDILSMMAPWLRGDDDTWQQVLSVLSPSELASLWHLPHEGFTSTSINWAEAGHKPLLRPLRDLETGIVVGTNRVGDTIYTVRLPQENRVMPTTIVGKPGRGKTSVMHIMIHHDIAAGRGVCVIDPKGSLVSAVLQHSIPPGREGDVVVLDVKTSVDGVWYPPPLNILQSDVPVSEDIAADQLVGIVERQFDDFQDRQMADTLSMAVMALVGYAGATVQDIYRLFKQHDFREMILATIADPEVKDFWTEYHAYGRKQQAALADPVLRRLRVFYRNRRLRAMTCHPQRLNLTELVAGNKIILVSLGADDHEMPELPRYALGTYLISQLDRVARRRVIEGDPFMLYVDETQEFITTPLPKMLSQLREYNLGLVLANQYFHQLFGKTLKALEGTASTFMGFEVGREDAGVLADYMANEFTKNDFMNMGKYKAGVSLVYDDKRQPAFTLENALPPGHGMTHPERERQLRRRAVENMGLQSYDAIHEHINQHLAGGTPDNDDDTPDDDFIEPDAPPTS